MPYAGNPLRSCLHTRYGAPYLPKAMTPSELKRHLQRVGMGQMEAARRLKVNARTVRRWVAGDSPIPEAVAQLVALWSARKRRMLPTS